MSASEYDMPLPPATFEFLVASLVMQAQMNMGMFHLGGDDEQSKPNLPLARHSIDLLAMLQDKTRGNLTIEEQRELENSLTELRFRYVQAIASAGKPDPETPATPETPQEPDSSSQSS
jgi:hypothetical protein